VEFDILTLGELAVAGGFDRGEVGEDICRTVVRLDESETLFRVEPLHGTCSHNLCILIFQLTTASAVLMVGSVTGSDFPVGWAESWGRRSNERLWGYGGCPDLSRAQRVLAGNPWRKRRRETLGIDGARRGAGWRSMGNWMKRT